MSTRTPENPNEVPNIQLAVRQPLPESVLNYRHGLIPKILQEAIEISHNPRRINLASLVDALLDVGCDNDHIIDHCRYGSHDPIICPAVLTIRGEMADPNVLVTDLYTKDECLRKIRTGLNNQDWNFWKGPIEGDGQEEQGQEDCDQEARDLAEFSTKNIFFPHWRPGESHITGEEKRSRMWRWRNQRKGRLLFSIRQLFTLFDDYKINEQNHIPQNSILQKLYKNQVHIDAMDVLCSPNGDRCVPVLHRGGVKARDDEWILRINRLDDYWYRYSRSGAINE